MPYQAEIHRSTARFRILDGGRRIGKSVIGGREAYAQMVVPGSFVWIVGPTMDLAEKEFRVAWRQIVDKARIPVRRKSERELFIQCENGSFLECRSEENPDQLIGEGLDLVVLAEAARLKLRTYDQYIRPAIADRKGKILATSTPRGFNYFYDFYERGQDTTQFKDWESWMIPSSMNPILGAEEIENAKATTSPEAFAQEWEAKFIAYGGLVFPEFDYDTHVSAVTFTSGLRTSLWIDPGNTAPYAVLLVQITPDEQVHVLDEIYRTGLTSDRIIDVAVTKWAEYLLDDFGNPSPELDVIIDQAAAEAAATWRLRGFNAHGVKPKIEQGIEVYHMFLRDPMRSIEPTYWEGKMTAPGSVVPRIQFNPLCKNTIKEHGQYHYPDETRKRIETNPSGRPVDVDNHSMDAIRYGLRNTFPTLFNETPEVESVEYASFEEMGIDLTDVMFEDQLNETDLGLL